MTMSAVSRVAPAFRRGLPAMPYRDGSWHGAIKPVADLSRRRMVSVPVDAIRGTRLDIHA